VLSSAKIGRSSWRYYQNSVAAGACEYYLGHGEAPGTWFGRGLPELGLEQDGIVAEPELEAVFARALHPVAGTPLGRAWRTDAVTGFDLTFSAPKSVSTLWALGGTAIGGHVVDAHKAAVVAALAYLDRHASVSRRGTDGVEQIATTGLVAALFDHRTSRAGDPQLHTHALVPNKLRCVDGVWRTVDGHEIYHHKKAAGAVYQAALRAELHARLGVVFEPVNAHGQAEIVGVPTELMTAWSKRTAQIAAEASPTIDEYEQTLGRDLTRGERATVTKTAVLKTRPPKDSATDVSVLHGRWRAEAAALGWDADRLRDTLHATSRAAGAARMAPATPGTAVVQAGRRKGVFSRADLTIEVAATLPLAAASGHQVLAAIEHLTTAAAANPQAVHLGNHPDGVTARASDTRYTSTEVLAAEARVLHLAAAGRGRGFGRIPAETVADLAVDGLADDQAGAVAQLTTGGDFLSVLTAPAGAGKTTTLGAAARVWQQSGYRVVGLAPSARAASELGKATGTATDTLAKWLHQQARLAQLLPAEQAAWTPTSRTVLVLDEASMASTFDLDALTGVAARAGAKVVLVGDPAQIGVINGPGGLLTALADRGHGIELSGAHRFENAWERDASLRLRKGDPTVIDSYTQAGRLHAVDKPDDALGAVFRHWRTARDAGADALMLGRTRTDVDHLNTLAKAAAQASGESHGPELATTTNRWQAGDIVRTKRNNRRLPVGDSHVKNGDRYRVLSSTTDDGLLVDDIGGRGRTLLPAAYVAEHVDYGWATTIDAAQGSTCDVAVLLVRPGLDREHLYVGMTRGRAENHAYITANANAEYDHPHTSPAPAANRILIDTLARSGRQDAAHSLLKRAKVPVAPRDRHTVTPPAIGQWRDGRQRIPHDLSPATRPSRSSPSRL
jgi:conjugative relaxase-like TrwC/TraI family protein